MRTSACFLTIFLMGAFLFPGMATHADESVKSFAVPTATAQVLQKNCVGCHGPDTEEGDIRFDTLATLSLAARLDLLNKAQEQLFFGLMPPAEADQPAEADRTLLAGWLRTELRKHGASQLDDKLRYPDYGNYIDHKKLFSGEIKTKGYTPVRRWLVSPQIFQERVTDVFKLEGRERDSYSKQGKQFYGVTNPFVLPDHSGVRYYDLSTLNGGHLLVMLDNAKWIAGKQIRAARVKSGEIDANDFPDARDRWAPRTTPQAFETVIQKKSVPTREELTAAIQAQFDCVLQRPATQEEFEKYQALTHDAIQLSGNTEGLRQMLVAVLLESEFLYRLEFGAGETDAMGRRQLSPREASYAISYALGDRNPDAELAKAAKEGRLNTRDDYRREVQRLLADENYYSGPVDHKISGKNMRSHETSHPKLVRFFREFFGYPQAAKIFKDIERSDGYYQNPGRGTLGTPGFLIKEADRVVDWYLKMDKNVFENLLTTEEFFVYHDKDNETGRKIIAEWTEAYERLKDTDWKKNPEGVLAEHMEFIKTKDSLKRWVPEGGHQRRTFLRFMHFFSDTIGKGRTPFTTVATSHGYTYHHSTFYGLPPTPNRGRYERVEHKNFKGELEEAVFWDYPVEQPFRIAKRKGLLTHPAWLIAHSSNFHTDPIKRGRWIREKLLAGQVPDVPITVDAQVPEDPHKTLRERVELVTGQAECRKCHERMNPLGFPFEVFDDFGRYRLEEPLEHEEHLLAKAKKKNGSNRYKTKPVTTLGELQGTDEPNLDGKVSDAFELIDRLAKSERVRQSIIRYAFRFFMGRNEMLSDSQTLIDADRAYVESDGSFRAVIISLLTSDSFIYRK